MMLPFNSSKQEWDIAVSEMSGAHILQSWDWGDFKSENGWRVNRFIWKNKNKKIIGTAQILEREQRIIPVLPNLRILYIPKGPLMMDWKNHGFLQEMFSDILAYAKKRKAIFIKIDPDILIEEIGLDEFSKNNPIYGSSVASELEHNGWVYSKEQIQYKNTVWINLELSEESLLNSMKQKTRYNLKLAQKKGVDIRNAGIQELPILYDLYSQTSVRDGFIIRSEKYYLSLWKRLMQAGMAIGLLAWVEGKPVAGLILFKFAKKAWYFYGMSSELHREKMPNYLLQWEAIRIAKNEGCQIYDLWGAPNDLEETDPMWGVVRFKLGLGGKIIKMIGAWDYPVNKFVYNIYLYILPRILAITRSLRKRQIKNEVLKTI